MGARTIQASCRGLLRVRTAHAKPGCIRADNRGGLVTWLRRQHGLATSEPLRHLGRLAVARHSEAVRLHGSGTPHPRRHLEAVRFLLGRAKVLVEPSGAAGMAALLSHKLPDPPATVGTVLTGGNADFEVLARILRREL